MTVSDTFIIEELNKIFSDKVVYKISKYPIYAEIHKICNSKEIDMKQYIESLGFTYSSSQSDLFTTEKLLDELTFMFPDKSYKKISDISRNNQALYSYINKQAKIHNIKPEAYLKSIGFTKSSNNCIKYDIFNLTKLLNEYSIKDADIARLMNCSGENIRQKLKKNVNKNQNEWLIPLSQEEITLVCDHIYKHELLFISPTFSFSIVDNLKDQTVKALVIRQNMTVKLLFEFPTQIKRALAQNLLDIFMPNELEFFQCLNKKWKNQGSNITDNKKIIILDTSEKNKIKNWASAKALNIDEYLALIDFSYADKRYISDEEILSKILVYADSNNNINLHVTDKDYYFFTSHASRNNMSIYDFFDSYGYHYIRGHFTGDIYEKHKFIIKSRYIIQNNIIYIPSYDPYYRTLTGLAYNKRKTLDELLQLLGFNRIPNKKNLPLDYIPYDYTTALVNSDLVDEDKIATALAVLSNSDNQVYLDITSYIYYNLFLQAKLANNTITEILKNYGYIRVYKRELIEDIDERYEDVQSIIEYTEQEYIRKVLGDLKNIQSKYKNVCNTTEKLVRNKELVSSLKDLYQCKCQLCNPENPIPPICAENGTIYSEVHHITSLHEAKSDADIEFIDSYKNTIVLCPYHHKYVHIQNGGFNIMTKDENDILFLENTHGDKLKIYINYHL